MRVITCADRTHAQPPAHPHHSPPFLLTPYPPPSCCPRPAQHTSVCREIDSRDFTMADLKKDVPVEAASHRIRITLTSRNVANLEKGACAARFVRWRGGPPTSSLIINLSLPLGSVQGPDWRRQEQEAQRQGPRAHAHQVPAHHHAQDTQRRGLQDLGPLRVRRAHCFAVSISLCTLPALPACLPARAATRNWVMKKSEPMVGPPPQPRQRGVCGGPVTNNTISRQSTDSSFPAHALR